MLSKIFHHILSPLPRTHGTHSLLPHLAPAVAVGPFSSPHLRDFSDVSDSLAVKSFQSFSPCNPFCFSLPKKCVWTPHVVSTLGTPLGHSWRPGGFLRQPGVSSELHCGQRPIWFQGSVVQYVSLISCDPTAPISCAAVNFIHCFDL